MEQKRGYGNVWNRNMRPLWVKTVCGMPYAWNGSGTNRPSLYRTLFNW